MNGLIGNIPSFKSRRGIKKLTEKDTIAYKENLPKYKEWLNKQENGN